MDLNWQSCVSTRIVAEAYDAESETIFVEFPKGGVQWFYASCPPDIWEQFTAPGQSRGRFIHEVLNHKPNARFS